MIKRKKNIIFAQIILFILGVFIIIYTYYNNSQTTQNQQSTYVPITNSANKTSSMDD